MFHPSSNTARTHAHTSISTLKSLVNFCSRDFLFHKEFDDSTLAKRHIVVGHFVRSDTSHVMQAIDVTRHSRITQQLFHLPPHSPSSAVPSSHAKNVAHDFRYGPRRLPLHVKSTLPYREVITPAFGNTPQPSAWGGHLEQLSESYNFMKARTDLLVLLQLYLKLCQHSSRRIMANIVKCMLMRF